MGFWSWLFPSDEEKIARAKELLREEQFHAAREFLRVAVPAVETCTRVTVSS